jgi:lipopolysaccharide heptosyltransferase II
MARLTGETSGKKWRMGTSGRGRPLNVLRAADPAAAASEDAEYEQRPAFEQRLTGLLGRVAKRAAQWLMRRMLGTLGYLTRERAPLSPLRPADASIRRILVIRVDLLGDTVLLTAAIRALRRGYPDAELDVLVLPSTAGVLAGDPDIAHVLTCDPFAWLDPHNWTKLATWRDVAACLRRLRVPRYDLVVSACGDTASILTRMSGARRRVGYAEESYAYFMTDPVPGGRYREPKHEVRYVLDLAAAAGGIVVPEDAQPWLLVSPGERCRIAASLRAERARLGISGPIVAIHPGARNGKAKRWPLRHYAVLADRLVEELDALVVLTGSPNEAGLARAVLERLHVRVVDLTGKTTLPELVALLAESDVVVTGDSGPMHIACAVQTPVVALHGPTDPAQSGPTAPDAIVLRHHLWCSPCYDSSATAECRFGNPVCMKALAPDLVFAAIRRQLTRHARPEIEHAAQPSEPSVAAASLP